jgi:hypothetical protein
MMYYGPSSAGYPRKYDAWDGLVAPFIDGLLREAKPGMVYVDGFEQAYGYRTEDQYAKARRYIKETARKGSSVPDLYSEHVQAGFAVWPDCQSGAPPRKSFDPDNPNHNYYTPDELTYAAHQALAYSDHYVWAYEESINYWDGWVSVYSADGQRSQKPIPHAYIDALEKARNESVPSPRNRDR